MPPLRGRALLLAVATLAVTLSVAYTSKVICRGDRGSTVIDRDWCYSDLRSLWDDRGFDRDLLPYATRLPREQRDDPPVLEYPPGIGFGAWLVARATDSERGFLQLTAATLAVAAAVAAWQLDVALRALGRPRARLMLFAASPTLAVLGMQNWDLWSIAPAAAGLAAAARGRPTRAAAWLGLAAAIKWWPALLVVPLLVGRWSEAAKDRDHPARRWRPLLAFAMVWAAAQLPAVALSPAGWWQSIAFHVSRPPNRASPVGIVAWVGDAVAPSAHWRGAFVTFATWAGFVTLLAGGAYVAVRLHRRRLDPPAACLALVALFLLTSKVVSVQFLLWLLAVAVVAEVPWPRILLADVLNAAVWLLWAPVGDRPVPLFWVSLAVAAARSAVIGWALAGVLRQAGDRAPAGRAPGPPSPVKVRTTRVASPS